MLKCEILSKFSSSEETFNGTAFKIVLFIWNSKRNLWRADVADVDGEKCYAVEGTGKHGWCKVRPANSS